MYSYRDFEVLDFKLFNTVTQEDEKASSFSCIKVNPILSHTFDQARDFS